MDCQHIVIWNAWGLNSWVRRHMVKEMVASDRVSLVFLQETITYNR
jgi:hypothetical protein